MKKRLTLEQHKFIGKELHRIRHELLTIKTRISNSYSQKDSPARFIKISYLDECRSRMESLMFKDFPVEADIKTYYPGTNIDFKVE